jgi:peptide-methionine (S)-S-oxide reductase
MMPIKALRPALAVGVAAIGLLALLPTGFLHAEDAVRVLPAPIEDVAPTKPGLQTALFAGGCFWGIQGVFEHIKGVHQAVSGYAGGKMANPSYEQVSTGTTGHAESVRVTFDPDVVSYGKLLQIFFSVALDPTEVDQQGPDWGTQYRSELFVATPEQAKTARAYIAQLDGAHVFNKPIATKVDQAGPFYVAEGYHQDYLTLHPTNAYIAYNDIPKVEHLKALFPQNWLETPVKTQVVALAK